MSRQILLKLIQNYIELLDDDEYYDVTIEVGKDPNVRIFRAHMNILCYRSPYLRQVLTSNVNKENNNNVLSQIKLPNILPKIFHIILEYIYGGIILLNEQNISDIIKVLLAANELLLQELVDYLQKYLIENKSEWMEQHFELIHQTSFQTDSLLELQQFCTDFMVKSSAEKIFKSLDFTSIPEKSLIQLIKRDDLQIKEIEVWEHVLKWGLAQNPTLLLDPDTWSDDNFKTMENTLQHCLPLIRFFSLSSIDFLQKVHPYKKLLKHQFYEELLNSHMNPNSKPTNNILPPRNIKIDEVIDSKIVSLNIISTISRWISRSDVNNNFAHIRELNLPYKFKLLLRGSRDGFTPKKFHELCDNKPHTISFIKVKGTEEIIGGYNTLEWRSSDGYGKTNDSFIFSFKNGNNFIKDAIISNVENIDCAFYCSPTNGPHFGSGDISIGSSNESGNYCNSFCKKGAYEKKIRDTGDHFSIEDYEVFQIIKK